MTTSPEEFSEERQALVEALQLRGPQIGARLKVLLVNDLARRRNLSPIERATVIPRLSAFLAKHSDLVEVTRGPSDIFVKLRSSATPQVARERERPQTWYRSDVWHAFLNPDAARRRYFHRATHEIVHYVLGSQSSPNPAVAHRVEADRGAWVEIAYANAARQVEWMRDFLQTTSLLPDSSKKIGTHFLTVPFESSVNAAFAASLGEYSTVWKKYRTAKADEQIREWARTNGIDLVHLQKPPEPVVQVRPESIERPVAADEERASSRDGNLRATLLALIDSMDDAELRAVQVPASSLLRVRRQTT